ncbi:amino acid adenylation domain-containing protein [Actinomycetospora cinnamomea]|uniref:Amino acid adenylation domain-containing protein n=1 Tax=Actinomycetospora cinnamomea TaxID=663609 RepID=A0A2U1FRP4_9PSEU|nr:amino acid adenylation domain-containing protein [Actinomycetospora cinnamomea]PVZ14829.1 amino acid adenylation domain-containing protein [Actinomycetospora cinnamomea]
MRTDVGHLQDLLAASAERHADRTAIVGTDEAMTYAELDGAVNRVAHVLLAHGVTAGARVCVLAEKAPWTIAALIGTLRAGGAYVPVDPAGPATRVARIIGAAEPAVVLVDAPSRPLLDEVLAELPGPGRVGGPTVGSLDDAPGEFTRADLFGASPEAPNVAPADLAHLLFTSGSTGAPKGVMITHDTVLAFVDWAVRHFGTKAGDRISGHPPLHFDLSTFDIYATLAAGAELHLVPGSLGVDPRGTAAFIRDRALTQWFSVPSVLTYLARFDAVAQDDFPALERLLWCGEVLPTPVLAHWMRRLPHVRFTNLYGPTEATIASSFHDVPQVPADETVPVPIGRACDGERLLVLSDGRETPPGEIGELYLGGVGLSPGYWRDQEKTDAAFVTGPDGERIYRTGDLARVDDDGVVHFLGRADSQVKSRGYRIELGEIEAALATVPGIRECAVVGVDTGGFEGTTICCAYSVAEGHVLPATDVRRQVGDLVPKYMVPARWAEMDDLPHNVNGKIDRPALRERFAPAGATTGGR